MANRVLIFIVAYNAEQTIRKVVQRIPLSLKKYDTHILIIDDASKDCTFECAREMGEVPFPMTILTNPVNQGYGGNQKIGFHYAIEHNYDVVALVHGDGQYAPEELPNLLEPLLEGSADAVFGSRMMVGFNALKGGMPLYKFVGNKILTTIQNRLLKSKLSEFHSGYRLYSVDALRQIAFSRNTNNFHFDTEIIIQLLRAGFRIKELPIPTFYGDEICHVNGIKYALDVITATVLSRAQDYGLLYQRKYSVQQKAVQQGRPKWGFDSPQSFAFERIPRGTKVASIGVGSQYVCHALEEKGCSVTYGDYIGSDGDSSSEGRSRGGIAFQGATNTAEYVLLLDFIEQLRAPEEFVDLLRNVCRFDENVNVVVSTGNIGFCITRVMLFLGYFHYGMRGILNLDHRRLFTFATLRELFEQSGYQIVETRGIPAPFPLVVGPRLSRFLLAVNRLLIRVSRSFFAYQIYMVVRPLPTLERLLESAVKTSEIRTWAARGA